MGMGVVVMAIFQPDPGLLARQISSLRAQTVTEWTCLVGLDGHDVEARGLVEQLTADDSRFRIVMYEGNVGVYRHFERLLTLVDSTACWIALADQDDYWYERKLETLLQSFVPGVSAVVGQARVVSAAGEVSGFTLRRTGNVRQMLLRNQVTGSLTLFAPDVLDLALPFPRETATSMHDHWLGVCAASNGRIATLPGAVQDYVQHTGNLLGEVGATTLKGECDAARKHGGLLPHLHYVAEHRWGWRVSMARALLTRNPRSTETHFARAVADSRMAASLWGIWRAALEGHIRWRAALGTTAAALVYAVTRTGGQGASG